MFVGASFSPVVEVGRHVHQAVVARPSEMPHGDRGRRAEVPASRIIALPFARDSLRSKQDDAARVAVTGQTTGRDSSDLTQEARPVDLVGRAQHRPSSLLWHGSHHLMAWTMASRPFPGSTATGGDHVSVLRHSGQQSLRCDTSKGPFHDQCSVGVWPSATTPTAA